MATRFRDEFNEGVISKLKDILADFENNHVAYVVRMEGATEVDEMQRSNITKSFSIRYVYYPGAALQSPSATKEE